MMLGPFSAPSSPPETPQPTKCRPRLPQRGLAPPGVGVVRVAAVHDDVALVEQRHELIDHGIGGSPALTITMIARGRPRLATKSSIDSLGHERAFVAVLARPGCGCARVSGCAAPRRARAGRGSAPGCGPSRPARSRRCLPCPAGSSVAPRRSANLNASARAKRDVKGTGQCVLPTWSGWLSAPRQRLSGSTPR